MTQSEIIGSEIDKRIQYTSTATETEFLLLSLIERLNDRIDYLTEELKARKP